MAFRARALVRAVHASAQLTFAEPPPRGPSGVIEASVARLGVAHGMFGPGCGSPWLLAGSTLPEASWRSWSRATVPGDGIIAIRAPFAFMSVPAGTDGEWCSSDRHGEPGDGGEDGDATLHSPEGAAVAWLVGLRRAVGKRDDAAGEVAAA